MRISVGLPLGLSLVLSAILLCHLPCASAESVRPIPTAPNAQAGTVSFTASAMTMNVGETVKLEWVFMPVSADVGEGEIKLTSSIPSVAVVDETGTVTALSGGMTLISIEAPDGSSSQIPLRVKDPSIPLPG